MQDEGERLGYLKESIVTREAPVYLLIQVRDYPALCPTFEQGRTLGAPVYRMIAKGTEQ